MNDDFLNRFQKSPRAEFESALYLKINKSLRTSKSKVVLRRLSLSISIVLAIFALTVIFVPTARAAVQSVISKIAGLYFDEVTENPITCDPMECLPPDEFDSMTLEKAQAVLPFTFNLPTWTPEGYWLNPSVKVYKTYTENDSIQIEWLKTGFTTENHEDYVQQMALTAMPEQEEYPAAKVGVGSVSEIKINDQPAALIRGAWELFNKNWNGDATQLTWARNGVRYVLAVGFIEPATVISDEDVIRIAESIP